MNLGRLPIVEPMGSMIRVAAIVMSGIVLLGFAFFAVDEMNRGSQNQQNALDSELQGKIDDPSPIAPSPKEESLREKRNSGFRGCRISSDSSRPCAWIPCDYGFAVAGL